MKLMTATAHLPTYYINFCLLFSITTIQCCPCQKHRHPIFPSHSIKYKIMEQNFTLLYANQWRTVHFPCLAPSFSLALLFLLFYLPFNSHSFSLSLCHIILLFEEETESGMWDSAGSSSSWNYCPKVACFRTVGFRRVTCSGVFLRYKNQSYIFCFFGIFLVGEIAFVWVNIWGIEAINEGFIRFIGSKPECWWINRDLSPFPTFNFSRPF